MQLLTFTMGLALLSVVGAMMPPLTPARAEQGQLSSSDFRKVVHKKLGGNMPIPSWKWSDPLPPFSFERNHLGELEFRMNLTKPIGCIPFKLPLYEGKDLGMFFTWWRHTIHIHFLPGKNFAIAYFRGKMNYQYYQIMMLMGRTLEADLDAVRIFKEFVESKLPKTGKIITPPHVEACELAQDS